MNILKRSLSFLLSLVLVFSMLPGMAIADETTVTEETTSATESEPALWEYEIYGDGIVLTAYNGTAADVYVPSEVDELTVIKLGDSLFYDNDSLNSVTLGGGILEIGEKAFYDCDNMVCILISEELTTIGAQAFYSCDNFNSVILYDAVTAIGGNAFAECPKLTIWCNEFTAGHIYATENTIPYEILNPNAQPETYIQDGITYYILNGEAVAVDCDSTLTEVNIPAMVEGYPVTELRRTFENCTALRTVELPVGLRIIGDKAFYSCAKLSAIEIPTSVTTIGEDALRACKSLTEVVLPDSVESIGEGALANCQTLVSITLPKGLSTIPTNMFYYCLKLENVVFPDSLQLIKNQAFLDCISLKQVNLPNGLLTIENSAFGHCIALREVYIPDSVTTIGNVAFSECEALSTAVIPAGVASMTATTFPNTTVLQVWEDSFAHTLCVDNGLLYFLYNGINAPEIYTLDNISYYVFDNKAIAYRREANVTTVTIPETVGGYPVKELRYAFINCGSLTSVLLPQGLEYIAANAFDNCRALMAIDIPNSVTELGKEAFRYCTNLTSVTLPDNLTTISQGLFYECGKLESIDIPDSVTEIGASAFSRCKSLQTIDIPEKVTTIGNGAFVSTAIVNCHIPENVVTLGTGVFGSCTQLKEVTLPDTITEIKDELFSGCTSLESFAFPQSVTKICRYAFYNCKSLTSISFPDSLEEIDAGAFYNCESLYITTIPEKVTSIWSNPFPANMIWIVHENSFAHKQAVKFDLMYFLYNENETTQIHKIDGVYYYVQNGEAIAYRSDSGITAVVIPEVVGGYPVTTLNAAFKDCDTLRSVTLPEGLITIDYESFYGCSALESVNIPSTVKRIGGSAFSWCSKITELTLPEGLEELGQYAFSSTGLVEVDVPGSTVSWGHGAFSNCAALEKVVVQEGVTELGASAFYECYALNFIVLPDSIVSIEKHAFYHCTALVEIQIPDSVTNLGYYAFSGCTALEKIAIPAGLTSIPQAAFSGCSNLESVTFMGELTAIDTLAFSNCRKLSNMDIPETVTSIGTNAFSSCESMKTVVVPNSVSSIFSNSFPWNTILLVYEKSYAHTFAEENDLLYFLLRKTANPEIAYGAGVSGTVTYSDGTAAGGAVVEILYEDGTLKESVIADENGAYSFTYAEVGVYTVRATDVSGNTAASAISVKRMNVFEVFLAGDTALTLKKGWTVSGTVSESTAKVIITDTDGNVLDSMDALDGSFDFTNIPNGTYIIKAEANNGSVSQEITVFGGNLSGIILTVATQTVVLWGYVEVEDRNYAHHRRNWVQVTVYDAEGVAVGQARSDSDGMYCFAGLPVGTYSIVAETSELRPDKKYGYDRNYTLTGYAYVDASTAGTYQADTIVLYEENDSKATIGGKVTAQGENQCCQVLLSNVFRHEVASMTTKNNGKYSFTNIRDGLYFITAITESNGMGYAVVTVRNGEVYGDTDIKVYKTDKVKDREDKFKNDVPECAGREDALKHRDRIAEEKRCYDALSEKEKKQLSKDYVERLNLYCEWIANTEYQTDEGVTVEQGGLVISGDELEHEDTVCFNLTVERTEGHIPSTDGVYDANDQIHHDMRDAADKGEIRQYYEITMTRTVDGTERTVTSVSKDTDAMGKFRITMEIPDKYRGHKHYTMVHVHNGETVTLADLDDDPNTITFEVDKFSTYALVSTDEAMTAENAVEVYTGTTLAGSYANVEEALTSYDPACQYIKLTGDTEETLSLTSDVYIDLNGYILSGTLDTNGYTVYGMDSATDKYACDTMGYFNCVDENENTVVPASNVKTDVTGSIKRYLAISTENGYTFHRFYLGVTHASIKPGVGGVGYKAVFAGDEMVQAAVESYGYSLQLQGFDPVVTENTGCPVSGKAFTLRVENYNVDSYGETDLTAQVYITVNGETISASAYTTTLKDMVQAVDANAAAYTATQLQALKAWLSKYDITQSWI